MSTEAKREAVVAEIPRLRRYAIALMRDRSAADDLMQDCVVRALDKLHLWRDGTNMRTWLFTMMHNLHANEMRQRSRMRDNRQIDPCPSGARRRARNMPSNCASLPMRSTGCPGRRARSCCSSASRG
ncbi:MAG: sigma factor [Alphaproteobacteria bacterium]|jgi:DNA-directed RNA polymerase specialized sigma24 family protein